MSAQVLGRDSAAQCGETHRRSWPVGEAPVIEDPRCWLGSENVAFGAVVVVDT